MEWGQKPLKNKDVEVIFAVLNEEHAKIMRGLEKLIKEFKNRGDPNPFINDDKKGKRTVKAYQRPENPGVKV